GGVLKGPASRFCGAYLGPQHIHPGDIWGLPGNVHLPHMDHAFHAHQGTDRGGGHPVLSGTGLGNDPFFSQPLGDQDLPYGIVHLMGPGMAEVLPFEVDLAAVPLGKAPGRVQGGGAAHIIPEQLVEFLLKGGLLHDLQVMPTEFLTVGVEHFRDVRPPEFPVISLVIYVIALHFPWFCVEGPWYNRALNFFNSSTSLSPGSRSNLEFTSRPMQYFEAGLSIKSLRRSTDSGPIPPLSIKGLSKG